MKTDAELYDAYLDAAKVGGKENAHNGLRAVYSLDRNEGETVDPHSYSIGYEEGSSEGRRLAAQLCHSCENRILTTDEIADENIALRKKVAELEAALAAEN